LIFIHLILLTGGVAMKLTLKNLDNRVGWPNIAFMVNRYNANQYVRNIKTLYHFPDNNAVYLKLSVSIADKMNSISEATRNL
jgi:hypothetical protein